MIALTLPTRATVQNRSGWGTEPGTASDFGVARSIDTLDQAFRLVHDQYVARGYMRPDPNGWRLSSHHALPWTKVFVARTGSRVVGTVALIPDSPIGLPMDGLYGAELAPFRQQARHVAEVSGLAIAEDFRSSGVAILKSLVRLLLLYAIEVRGYDDICIAVNPRHVGFYRRVFPHAHEIGERRAYDKVNGAPAVALRIDLRMLRTLLPAIQTGAADVAPAYRFFFGTEDSPAIIAQLRRQASTAQLTARQFRHFFSAHPALARASAATRAFIQSFYPTVEVDAVIEEYRSRPHEATGQPELGLAVVPV